MFVRDSLIIATWQDFRFDEFGDDEAMAMFSADTGLSWTSEERLSFGDYHSHAPVACVTPGNLHVLWGDQRTAAQGLYYCRNDLLTGIGNDSGGGILPEKKGMICAYPNPFNSSTTITMSGAEEAEVGIYDITGRLVERLSATNGRAVWEARGHSSGVYFARLAGRGQGAALRLLLLK